MKIWKNISSFLGKNVCEESKKLNKNYIYGEYDSLIFEVGKFLIEKNEVYICEIDAEMLIGFERAQYIVDQLEQLGVVSEMDLCGQRKVLVKKEQLEDMERNFRGEFKDYAPKINYENKDHTSKIDYEKSRISNRVSLYNGKFDYMDGHDFEFFCAEILRGNGFSNVKVTQGSNDNGIDIIAFNGKLKYGIQCKCYSSEIGVRAIQEAYTGAKFYNCDVPAVLTNRYFTKQAIEMARKTGVLLWDRSHLQNFILVSEQEQGLNFNTEEKENDDIEIKEETKLVGNDSVTYSLYANNKLSVMSLTYSAISAAKILVFSHMFLDKIWKHDYIVAVEFEDEISIATRENGETTVCGRNKYGENQYGLTEHINNANEIISKEDEEKVTKMSREVMQPLFEFVKKCMIENTELF